MIKEKANKETKEKILGAALLLFLEHGYKKVSYEVLTKKTGLSKGAIYHYFPSKDDLLVSVFKFLMSEAGATPGVDRLNSIKDYASFKRLIVDLKMEQMTEVKTKMQGQPLKLNKFLFFFEAISENPKLKSLTLATLEHEKVMLEKCFLVLKKKKENTTSPLSYAAG